MNREKRIVMVVIGVIAVASLMFGALNLASSAGMDRV